jgi:hypothetical protein
VNIKCSAGTCFCSVVFNVVSCVGSQIRVREEGREGMPGLVFIDTLTMMEGMHQRAGVLGSLPVYQVCAQV